VARAQARLRGRGHAFWSWRSVSSLLAALPDALLALWLKLFADGLLAGNRVRVYGAAIGLGVSATATWFPSRRQRSHAAAVSRSRHHRARSACCPAAGVGRHARTFTERPEYLNRLAVLRDQVFVLDHMYWSVFSTCGWILRLGVTVVAPDVDSPALALLTCFALPTVLTSTWRPGVERAAEERGAPDSRWLATCCDRNHRTARQGSARHRHRRSSRDEAP